MKWLKIFFFSLLVLFPIALFTQVPQNIIVSQVDSATLHVSWSDLSDEDYFEVSISTITKYPTVGPLFFTVGQNVEEYTFHNLVCGHSYAITVAAVAYPHVYRSGEVIQYLSCDSLDVSIPSAPSDLIVSYTSKAAILTWDDNSYNEDGFLISKMYKQPGMPSVREWIQVISNVRLYCDTAVQKGMSYAYSVIGYNEYGMSDPSNRVEYIHDVSITLMGQVYNSNNVRLSWIDNSTFEADVYVLYWSDGGEFVDVYTLEPDITSTNFPSPSCGDNYFYLQARKTAYGDLYGKVIQSVSSDTVHVTITDPSICGINDVDNDLSYEFKLYQNYPNPFNPSTTIQYSVPSEQSISVKIYNVLGTLVKTVVDEKKQSGQYTISVDLSDVSSGVYFYTLQGETNVSTKKMLFVK